MTPTAISHQIRLLEQTLDTQLFLRQVRRVVLTDAGQRLYPALRDGFDGFERALSELSPPRDRKAVTLTATTLFTARRLLPELGSFRSAHPEFDLRLHASDDVVDLASGLADIAVRYGSGPFPGHVSERLLTDRFGILCSPSLGLLDSDGLRRATLLHTEWRRPNLAPDWARWARLARFKDLNVEEGPRFTDDGHALQAAVAGHGVIIASLVLAQSEIASGLLIHPFGPTIPGSDFHLVATPENMACADVRAVRDWLVARVGD